MAAMRSYCPQTVGQLSSLGASKGERFEKFDEQFDYAMPQDWLDTFAKWCEKYRPKVTYHLIMSSTVWAYPGGWESGPVTCCTEVQSAYDGWVKS